MNEEFQEIINRLTYYESELVDPGSFLKCKPQYTQKFSNFLGNDTVKIVFVVSNILKKLGTQACYAQHFKYKPVNGDEVCFVVVRNDIDLTATFMLAEEWY